MVMTTNQITNAKTIITSFTVLALVATAYLLMNLVLPGVTSWYNLTYVAQPLLWFVVAALVLLISKYSKEAKLSFKTSFVKLSLAIGVFHVSSFVIAGFYFGFAGSPHFFTAKGILINSILIISTLFGMELSRAYLINIFAKRYFALGLFFISVLFALTNIPLLNFTTNNAPQQAIAFLGSKPLPLFAESLLASLLAFLGGPLAAIAYRGVLQLFQWFSPILPDLPWAATAFIGVMAPIIGILVAASLNKEKLPETEAQSEERSSFAGWIVVAAFALIFSWFLSGLLGPQPILVAGRSMSPQLELGDIAITKKIPTESIKVNDIIRYQTEHGTAIHRVIEVKKKASTSLFVTKGDANDSADADPVRPEQIQGKVVYIVSKIGWVSIGIKNFVGMFI